MLIELGLLQLHIEDIVCLTHTSWEQRNGLVVQIVKIWKKVDWLLDNNGCIRHHRMDVGLGRWILHTDTNATAPNHNKDALSLHTSQ